MPKLRKNVMKFDEMIKDRVKYNRMPTKYNSTVRSKSIKSKNKSINCCLLLLARKIFMFYGIGRFQSTWISTDAQFFCLRFGFVLFLDNCIQKTDLIDVDSTLSLDSLFEETIQIFNVTNFHPVNAVEPNTPVTDMKSWFC